jgi:N-acetylmuramoyl-L-alanine amidase
MKKTPYMRPITEIIIHCTGTVPSSKTTIEAVRKYHIEHNGWKDIGYHFLITVDGKVWAGRPLDQAGAHCKGHNASTIGVCYVGGLDANQQPCDTRNEGQKAALRSLVKSLKTVFPTIKKVSGHCQYSSKPCPCFDVTKENY